ncbi:hypothetical protein BgiBS90_005414, partial [Biomphalaria glabrata]
NYYGSSHGSLGNGRNLPTPFYTQLIYPKERQKCSLGSAASGIIPEEKPRAGDPASACSTQCYTLQYLRSRCPI